MERQDAEYGWDNLVSTYLQTWDGIAPDHERLGLVRWIAQIAAGELTEADFKEVA